MLMDFEMHFEKTDLYPKSKYRLYINSYLSYTMVTTSRSEKECVDLLVEKANGRNSNTFLYYKITKVNSKNEEVLKRGKIFF